MKIDSKRITAGAVLMCACACAIFTAGKCFGNSEFVTINKGFVFHDGHYLTAPYKIQRDGNTITINGNIVYQPQKKHQPEQAPANVQDPGKPSWITKNTTLSELMAAGGEPKGIPFQKWHYLIKSNSSQNTTVKLIRYLQSLPCIAKIELRTPINDVYYVSIFLTLYDGQEFGLLFDGTSTKQDEVVQKLRMSNEASDPGVPTWINKDTSLFDLVSDYKDDESVGVLYKKWDYLVQTNSAPDAKRKLIAYIRSLPCVSDVTAGLMNGRKYFIDITVTSKKGDKLGLCFASRQERLIDAERNIAAQKHEKDPQAEAERTNKEFSQLQERLSGNGAIFCYRNRVSILQGDKMFVHQFPLVNKILCSNMTAQEKEQYIRAIGLTPGAEFLVKNYKASEQLNHRLAELEKSTGVSPMTMDELHKQMAQEK